MGIIITPQEDIDAYFESEDLGQSSLKKLLEGFNSFIDSREAVDESPEKSHLIIGSAVDLILTGQEGEFNKQYYISPLEKKPSDVERMILNDVFTDAMESYTEEQFQQDGLETLDKYRGSILSVVDEHGWQSRWKEETRVNKIVEIGSDYFEDMKKAFGKTVLSQENYNTINEVVMSLRTNPRTSKYFDRETQGRNANVDFYYQLPIYFNYRGVACKALLDLLVVIKDESGRIVALHPYDVKTFYGITTNFVHAVKNRRYDIQGAWYTLALKSWLSDKNISVDDVHIKNFQFIVESTKDVGNPLVYMMTDSLMSIGQHGREPLKLLDTNFFADEVNPSEPVKDMLLVKEVRGFESLLDEYIWYEEHGWHQEKVLQENEGVLTIDWNGII